MADSTAVVVEGAAFSQRVFADRPVPAPREVLFYPPYRPFNEADRSHRQETRPMARKEGGIRDFFNSVRLTIVLLAAIALGALLGTIIPQQEAAEAVSSRLHPVLLSVFQAFQLFDVYHSAWFTLLLVLLAAKLIACSLNRFPAAWNFYGVWRSYGGLLRFFMRKYLPLFIDNLTCRLSMYVD